jgi:NADH-quinone oxidoreductase subunit L
MYSYYLTIVLAPLFAAIVAGLFGHRIGRKGAHSITIGAVGLSCVLSFYVLYRMYWGGAGPENISVYTWAVTDGLRMEVGFLVDRLTVLMMSVVTFVSLMVHVYTIGYMHDDPGYQRFFSYISLFTFSMLMLVMSNNFLQLFFGWEAVGLVSYLLIGFWFKRETAIFANLKAFLVNRVGDFGFILGIAAVVMFAGSLDYATVFGQAEEVAAQSIEVFPGTPWNAMTLICILLFIGAMGKSAQAPLHVWLPDSMEGPTPISALIHAATMVTAGIFMVARMSPLYEFSTTALAVVIVIGAITAFFMGLLGIVQNDIKRVVAYSTLSQLGYMTVAQGAVVPRSRLGDHRDAPRAGHSQDGRHPQVHADHLLDFAHRFAGLDRIPGHGGLLLQGPADRGRQGITLARRRRRLLDRLPECAAGRICDGAVLVPHVLPRVPWRRANGQGDALPPARDALGRHGAARDARDTVARHRLVHGRAGAVRRLLRRRDPCRPQPRRAGAHG